ncbi:DUF1798 family protein [Staphylococcus simulans]|uniref:DUF1798 family protein n=1 Tax=Staphylococcus simulans TaxID=1286 RepID=UPI000D027502|nr:DUF1798 family protein [Staphylococcus simulans]
MDINIEKLIKLTQEMEQRYQAAKNGTCYAFKEDVVPFVSHIDEILFKLDGQAEHIVALPYMNKLKYEILKENIEKLSVECHDSKTSRKMFMEKLKSVNYDLNYIKDCEKYYG